VLAIDLNPIDWVTDAAKDVVSGAFDFLATWISDALSWLAGQLLHTILGAGSADVSDRFFAVGGPANVMFWLGLVSVVVGLIAQTTSLMWRSDAGMAQLTESVLDLPVTLLMMFTLPALGVTILQLFDLAAAAVGQDAVATGFGDQLQLSSGMPGFMRVIVGVLMIVALLVLYVEQLIRGHLATVLIILGPFSIAMRSWTPARVVFQATVKLFCALAITPLVMMLCLAVALLRYDATGALDISRGLGVLAGLILTIVAPVLANKLFPVGDGVTGAIAGGAVVAAGAMALKAVGSGANAAGAAASGSARMAQLVSASGSPGGGSSGGAGSAVGGGGGGSHSGGDGGGSHSAGGGSRSGGGNAAAAVGRSSSTTTRSAAAPSGSSTPESVGSARDDGATRPSPSSTPAPVGAPAGSSGVDRLLADGGGE
jgi:hypothetical protein